MTRADEVKAEIRGEVRRLLKTMANMRELEREIAAHGGGTWLGDDEAVLIPAVSTTRTAIDDLLTAGGNAHAGNLYRALGEPVVEPTP